MLAADGPYGAEVAAARQRLTRLRERLSHRAASRRDAVSELDPLGSRQPGNVAPARDAGACCTLQLPCQEVCLKWGH